MTNKPARPLFVTLFAGWYLLTCSLRLLQGLIGVLSYIVFPFTRELVPLPVFLLGLIALVTGFAGAVLYFRRSIIGLGLLLLFEFGGAVQTIQYHLENGFGLPYGLQDAQATTIMRAVMLLSWLFIITKISLLLYSRKYMFALGEGQQKQPELPKAASAQPKPPAPRPKGGKVLFRSQSE